MLLALLTLACATVPKNPRDIVFAEARAESLSEPSPALGKLVSVSLPFFAPGDTRAIVIDAEGHAAIAWPEGQGAPETLPFSEPVTEVSATIGIQATPAFCARTRAASLECLYFAGDVLWALRNAEMRPRIKRLTFPSLEGAVEALGAPTGPCVKRKGHVTCAEFRVDGFGATEKYSLVAPHIISPKETCTLLPSGVVECAGEGKYGQLGDGSAHPSLRTVKLALKDVDVVVNGTKSSCAHTTSNEVWCWGVVAKGFAFAPPAAEKLPLCPYNRAATDAAWKAEMDRQKVRVAECARTCGQQAGLDACLGCVMRPLEKSPVFKHEQRCDEPQISGDPTTKSWPAPEEISTEPLFIFASKPTKLALPDVTSVAASANTWCVITSGELRCSRVR